MGQTGAGGDRDAVLNATNIVDVVGEVCDLKPAGREFKCLCPFHDDRNPSMYIVPGKQIFHCFVCGEGGNAFDFVMKYHHLGFREALQMLADRAGIQLTHRPAEGSGGSADREALMRANALALRFFRRTLADVKLGRVARETIERRGITPDMVELFQIGAAPAGFDGLLNEAQRQGIGGVTLAAAGLAKPGSRGGHYDAFRDRLMFPILDQSGRSIAFGGRILNPEDTPKYLNSAESAVFDKSSTLYGLHAAYQAIRRERHAIVTEGYTDVIACHQAGITNVVATLGTALTTGHARLLRRVCDRVTLVFDGDEAGQRAAERAFKVLFAEPFDVHAAVLPGGADPDDLLKREDGDVQFHEAIGSAPDAFAVWVSRRLGPSREAGPTARAVAVEEALAELVELGVNDLPPVRRNRVLQAFARESGVFPGDVQRLAAKGGAGRGRRSAETEGKQVDGRPISGEAGASARPKTVADHALACVLALAGDEAFAGDGAEIVKIWTTCAEIGAYSSDQACDVASVARLLLLEYDGFTVSSLLSQLGDPAARAVCTGFVAEVERLTEGDRGRLVSHWEQCVAKLAASGGGSVSAGGSGSSGVADRLAGALERGRRGARVVMPRPPV